MQILYGCSNCTEALFSEIFAGKEISVSIAAQKYHSLLIKGLSLNRAKVCCLSGLPINREVTSKKWISYQDEREDNVHYHYYKTLNLPGLRQFMILFGAFFNTLKVKKKEPTYAICDCLNIANAYGMALACKLRKIPLVTIVTDLPDMMGGGMTRKINNSLFKLVDGFILLTEQMNDRVNSKKKPYLVLEGHVDVCVPVPESIKGYEKTLGKQVVLYAGSLLKLYGIQNLVEGFLKAELPNGELHIYGDGDYRDELIQIASRHSNVKYMGVRSNAEIVEAEQRAALLVNPRPSAPEYTKYSFPSKNMEYMVSGTPVLKTVLPGMPEEYYPYVYLLRDETPEGIAKELQTIFSQPEEMRREKGLSAREFVLKEKSNVRQGQRIITFLVKRWEQHEN